MKTPNIMKTPNLVSLRRAVPALAAACALFSGGVALAQPTISSIYPDGSVQFQWTNKLTFVTGGAAAVTNISVTFDCKPMGGAENIQIYTSAAGLTINGNNVSAPLQSNVVYAATIIVTDSTGASATNTASFDTIRPSYTWEAEDFDYGSGLFVDNPQLNAYAGKVAVPEVDAHVDYTGAVGTSYRPAGGAVVSTDANLGTEPNGDVPRTQYLASGQTDYDAGWLDAGNWANYTRHFPVGKWNVFMRAAGNSASQAELYQGGLLNGTFLGDFTVPASGGYQSYTWVPLTSGGNAVEWDVVAGSELQTLTSDTVTAGYNINFYLLLPVPPPVTQDATLSGIFPDGTVQFQPTNLFSFTINSSLGVQASKILVTLSGTNLAGKATSSIFQAGSGLTISGPATALLVTFPLATNTVYKAIVQATDANGFLVSQAVAFDTINPSFTWEAEDFDYGGGQFFDNPPVNAYATLQATIGVDGYNPNNGGTAYRPVVATGPDGDLGTEVNGDTPRSQYVNSGLPDYDTGWTTAGSTLWANYTRHYPAGKWNIYLRAAGNGGSSLTSPSAWLYQGGTNGNLLGRFVVRNVASWQIYTWTPLTDVAGNLLEWDTDGSQTNLTIVNAGGNWNANFFMLAPVDPNYKPLPFVSPITPDGNANMFAYANVLSFTANSVPGITSGGVVVTLNGFPATHLTFSGSSHALNVTCPIATNAIYSLTIKLTDANGSSTYASTIGTFAPTSYTFECEDWDHDSGQFINNPAVDAYAGLSGVEGVDAHNTSTGSQTYRPYTGGLCTETCGDQKRAAYVTANTNDYDVAYTATGFWANYTRTYPAGVYNVFLRASSPNSGGQNDAGRLLWVTSGVGTSTQTTSPIGTFNVPATGGWQAYTWAPLVDALGNSVPVTTTGSASTFQFYEDNGGFNANFFLLAPPDTAKPVLSQVYPNGSAMFQRTNTFSFLASSSAGIDPSSIVITLNGVVASGLVFGGTPTSTTVSCPLKLDTTYTAVVKLGSVNNDFTTSTFNFDTFSSSYYTFEVEDWDYNGGYYVTNYTLNGYTGLEGIANVDAYNSNGGGNAYRTNDLGNLGNEITGDVMRAQYVNAGAGTNDYDVGWTTKGVWANYTRAFPAGTYNIYARAASPSGQKAGADLAWVTSGIGTTNQTTNVLGVFNFPLTGGYQIYTFTPLVDANTNIVSVTMPGSASTMRLDELAGGYNLNFFMFVPLSGAPPKLSVSHSGTSVTITWTPAVGTLYASPAIAGPSVDWQSVGTGGSVTLPITTATRFFVIRQ
jgi:hypothetical protein